MSEDVLVEQAEANTQRLIATILASIHSAESQAAAYKNDLIAEGYDANSIRKALDAATHTYKCRAGTLMGKQQCECKPEIAFTEEVF